MQRVGVFAGALRVGEQVIVFGPNLGFARAVLIGENSDNCPVAPAVMHLSADRHIRLPCLDLLPDSPFTVAASRPMPRDEVHVAMHLRCDWHHPAHQYELPHMLVAADVHACENLGRHQRLAGVTRCDFGPHADEVHKRVRNEARRFIRRTPTEQHPVALARRIEHRPFEPADEPEQNHKNHRHQAKPKHGHQRRSTPLEQTPKIVADRNHAAPRRFESRSASNPACIALRRSISSSTNRLLATYHVAVAAARLGLSSRISRCESFESESSYRDSRTEFIPSKRLLDSTTPPYGAALPDLTHWLA